jgi:hypothetical protein
MTLGTDVAAQSRANTSSSYDLLIPVRALNDGRFAVPGGFISAGGAVAYPFASRRQVG